MKRREFIINSSLLIGATALLTGCGEKNLTGNATNVSNAIDCIDCNHCLDVCPKKINIPKAFSIYNNYKVNKDKKSFIENYNQLADNEKPEQCIKCAMCSNHCPKALQIPELLETISNEYKKMI